MDSRNKEKKKKEKTIINQKIKLSGEEANAGMSSTASAESITPPPPLKTLHQFFPISYKQPKTKKNPKEEVDEKKSPKM